jgi:hypothetical protein
MLTDSTAPLPQYQAVIKLDDGDPGKFGGRESKTMLVSLPLVSLQRLEEPTK